jgi:hypothetical protein
VNRAAVAVAVTETLASSQAAPAAGADDVRALRRRLASCTAQEAVLADFLEDDVREVQGALAAVGAWMGAVGGALRDPTASRHDLLDLALAEGPIEELEYLHATMLSLRRRLAQIAVRLPAPSSR